MSHYLSFNEPGFLFGLTVTLRVHRGLKRKQSNMNIDPKKKKKSQDHFKCTRAT